MTDPVDLLNRAAVLLCDLIDEAVDRFEQVHGEQKRDKWLLWMGAQAGSYAGLISHPTIGYALVDELHKTAAALEKHLPAWRRIEVNDRDSPRPHTVAELVDFHHGSMLDIARTILGDNTVHD